MELIKEVLKIIPRKIVGGCAIVYMIGDFAKQDVDWKILAMMSIVGVVTIITHWSLEFKNPMPPAEEVK